MTIDKDIQTLQDYHRTMLGLGRPDLTDAIKQGIEALRLLKHNRLIGAHHDPDLLPGETKD